MIKIILAIVIGLALGLVNAAGGTAYGMSQSNMVGKKEGAASDFMKDGQEVVFHEKRDEKTFYSLSGSRTVDATKPYMKGNRW